MIVFLSIIFVTNFKIQLMAHGFSLIILVSSLLSIGSYYVMYKIYEVLFVSDIK